MKKRAKIAKLATTTLMASAVTFGVSLVGSDLTPGSWEAHAMSGKSENESKVSEHKCGEGECGSKTDKGEENKCGEGECGAKAKKGAEASCGEETCGA